QVSKQFWSYLVNQNLINNPNEFINPLPHMSLVHGQDNVNFLKKRFNALTRNALFQGMEFTEDPEKLSEWIPLIMKDRTVDHPMAATKMDTGTDVNFGVLTDKLLDHLHEQRVNINYNHSVEDIKRTSEGNWEVKVRNYVKDTLEYHTAPFVFIGAG